MSLSENMQYKFSIITVNKNNGGGLKKTIESVINQTSKDFEYIIIDGGSTDGSVDIIKSYTNIHPNTYSIKHPTSNIQHCPITYWTSEPDSGVYAAMNKGIRVSNGEYLLFLNSGDYLVNSEIFEKINLKTLVADIICGKSYIIQSDKPVYTLVPPKIFTFASFYDRTINHQSTLIRRNLIEKYGMYNENFKFHADYEFWIKTIILNNVSTQFLDEIICYYSLDGLSSINNKSIDYKKEINQILAHPILQKFVPDYDAWDKKYKELQPLIWLKSKKIYFLVLMLYSFAKLINKKKK